MKINTSDLTNFIKSVYFKGFIDSCVIDSQEQYPFIHAQSSCSSLFVFVESNFQMDFSEHKGCVGSINEFLKLIPKTEEIEMSVDDSYISMKGRGTLKYAMTDPMYISSKIVLGEGLSSWVLLEEVNSYPYQFELDTELIKELKSALALTTSTVCVKSASGKVEMFGGGEGEHAFSYEIGECEENVEFHLDKTLLSMILAKNNEMTMGFDVGGEVISFSFGNVVYAIRTC